MVNTEDFIKRLEKILDYYALNASAFAEKIDVQRSSLSHLLSGRNKPSLDLILKITDEFPEVNLYWLLKGKGQFPGSSDDGVPIAEPKIKAPAPEKITATTQPDLWDAVEPTAPVLPKTETRPFPLPDSPTEKAIEQIVIFYRDGTFQHYNPNKA